MTFRLEANETISSGIRRLLLERVNKIIGDLTNPDIERDIGVHEARKNCKRVRSTYRLIRDEIGVDLYRQENIRFRDVSRLLAGARDSWVMVETLDRLISDERDRLPPQAFTGIRQDLVEQYESVLVHEQETQKAIPNIVESMLTARSQIENLPIERDDFSVFQGGLRRTYTRGRIAMIAAYAHPGSEIFHEWRKRVKYLWHQIEILESLWPKVFSMLADELHTLSNYLGDDHDLAVLRALILDQPKGFTNENELMRLVRLIDRERLELEAQARPLGERLYFDPPRTFVRRLETYWQAWQAEDQKRQAKLIKRLQKASPAYLLQENPWLSTTEMAASLEISPERVRQLILDQKLPAEKVGPIWVIKVGRLHASDAQGDEAVMQDRLLSTREAARQLNTTLDKIREWIQLGILTATKVGRVWVIREADLAALFATG